MDYRNFDITTLSVDQLAELIRHHDACYDRGESEIDDPSYDRLTRKLAELAPDHPLLHKIHSMDVSSLGEVRHAEPLLSLDKAYSFEEVLKWAESFARTPDEMLLVEPKYDGISAIYRNGVLATRGDGYTGENITDKMPLIELETKDYTGTIDREARGEILVRRDRFETLRQTIRSKANTFYKNSRNILAPLMKLKDAKDILAAEYGMKTGRCFLTMVDYDKFSIPATLNELPEKWDDILAEFEQLPYPQDGIVVKLADVAYRNSLGHTAHHPHGEIAFKFKNARATSRILDVEWRFGKSCLTPVARIEPIELGGTTIVNATLHNLQNVLERDVHIGDTIEVERAGDVIPYIVGTSPGKERRSALIDRCPSCGTNLIQSGPELCCPNRNCPDTLLKNLAAAVKNLGVERLGEPTLRQLGRDLGVKTLKDLFTLRKSDLMRLESFQDKSASNLIAEIESARDVPDYRLLAALNIANIGVNIAKLILTEMTFDALRHADVETLKTIKGIGAERAAALVGELKERSEELDGLLSVVRLQHSGRGTDCPRVCFTGKMPEKRSYYEAAARANGYEAVDDVTSALNLLVAADANASGGKLDKARKLGVKIVGLQEFLSTLNVPPAPEAGSSSRAEEAEQLSLF